ncbi:MAG: response regulator [Candidatus Promineifilaceae bacterium]|nr:response regulator [Candidatus Promineifilaceae bacterium]
MTLNVLIADDEPIIRMGLTAMLQELGHTVTAATNGREALRMTRRRPFDLAILDIKMPYTDGLQAAETLSRTAPLPIIILTAYSERDLVEQASDLPIHGYLVKPVQTEQLAAAIAVARKRFAEAQAQQAEAETLQQELKRQKVIDRAKLKLIETGLTEEEAYRNIQRRARSSRRPMHEIARAILQEDD